MYGNCMFFLPYILPTGLLSRIHNTHRIFVSIQSVHQKYEVLHSRYKSSSPIQSWCWIWIQIQDCYNYSIRNTFRLQGTTFSKNLYFSNTTQIQDKYGSVLSARQYIFIYSFVPFLMLLRNLIAV